MARPRQNQNSREQSTRAANPVHPQEYAVSDYYSGTEVLRTPEPPPGKVYRWCRVGREGSSDVKNTQKRLRQGWTIVDPKTIPQTEGSYVDLTTEVKTRSGNVSAVQVDDLVLMERDSRIHRIAAAENHKKIKAQQTAIHSNLQRDTRGQANLGFALEPEINTRITSGHDPGLAASPNDIRSEDII